MADKREGKEKSVSVAVGMGVAFGVIVGAVIGSLTGNVGLWVALGVALGAGVGVAFGAGYRSHPKKTQKTRGYQSGLTVNRTTITRPDPIAGLGVTLTLAAVQTV